MIKHLAEPRKEKITKHFWNFSTSSGWSRVPKWAWPRARERESGQHLLTQEETLQCHSGGVGGCSWTNHTAAAVQSQSSRCLCFVQSQSRVPPPHPRPRKHPTSLCSQCHRLPDGDGGGGRSQQECPSYLVEEVSGRRLLHHSPALHHLDGLRHHTHRRGEGHQEQQVCRRRGRGEGEGEEEERREGRRRRSCCIFTSSILIT